MVKKTTKNRKGADDKKRRAEPIKYISLQIKIWWDDRDESIHIAMPGRRITRIDRKEGGRKGNARTHRHLFEHLARYLREERRLAPSP